MFRHSQKSKPFCFLQVLVVANPANTNALILKENAPKIPAENITCLTRLDHNRALGQVAEKAGQQPPRDDVLMTL